MSEGPLVFDLDPLVKSDVIQQAAQRRDLEPEVIALALYNHWVSYLIEKPVVAAMLMAELKGPQ